MNIYIYIYIQIVYVLMHIYIYTDIFHMSYLTQKHTERMHVCFFAWCKTECCAVNGDTLVRHMLLGVHLPLFVSITNILWDPKETV